MKRFPEGVSGGQIRQELEREGLRPEDQTHLDRRKRDLKKWFNIEKIKATVLVDGKRRNVVLYRYHGERRRITDEGAISLKARAEVIHSAHGRCQMCGKTIEKHGITLVVDLKKPRDWILAGQTYWDADWIELGLACENCSNLSSSERISVWAKS